MNGHNSIPIIGKRKDSDSTVLLAKVLELSRQGKISAVALVMTNGSGEFRVSAAGQDIDGLRDGAVELFKQLDALLDAADIIGDKPPVVLNG